MKTVNTLSIAWLVLLAVWAINCGTVKAGEADRRREAQMVAWCEHMAVQEVARDPRVLELRQTVATGNQAQRQEASALLIRIMAAAKAEGRREAYARLAEHQAQADADMQRTREAQALGRAIAEGLLYQTR